MINKEKLYEAFGELIYAVAKADGLIQDEEISKLTEILQKHEWAKDVQWSFDYEKGKENSLENVYHKALDTCHQYGPSPEYTSLIEILEEVANASNGIDSHERTIIDNFMNDLKERFIRDLDNGKKMS